MHIQLPFITPKLVHYLQIYENVSSWKLLLLFTCQYKYMHLCDLCRSVLGLLVTEDGIFSSILAVRSFIINQPVIFLWPDTVSHLLH